ncbi:RibD family protein [Nocardioides iriomotensis]|uniref:Deaminase n=1 Tax=Nocardioides iriomotensis TaxID=715784 RepID=A0A4Q5IYE5_9ACTN|nr:dihydrofolate reductase family protein [Nocardioides iriomotensis]RYU09955.1 deaminase [Nocardioides iriomotensis]
MPDRPYTVLSCAMSLDGYLDDTADQRLVLSNQADLDRVDAVRAWSDAILVGAGTVRIDNPRLLVRDPDRRRQRRADGRPATPCKVTVTGSGDLDPDAPFFATGDVDKLVYCATDAVEKASRLLGHVATVVDAGQPVDLGEVLAHLHGRGIRRLMVEGGGTVLTQLLTAALADELHLVVAPFFVGDSEARRLVDDGDYPWRAEHGARLLESRTIRDVVLLRYALSARVVDGGVR